jgi:hypothetical protein
LEACKVIAEQEEEKEDDEGEFKQERKHLQTLWFAFAGSAMISNSAVTSNALYDLIHKAIAIGREFPDKTPHEIFPRIDRRRYAHRLAAEAVREHKRQLDELRGSRVGLAIDASSVGFDNVLAVFICQAGKRVPLLLKLQAIGRAGVDYEDVIESLIEELAEEGIEVMGVTSDGLPAQCLALNRIVRGIFCTFSYSSFVFYILLY